MKYDFNNLIDSLQENDPSLTGLGLILEKEILHYEILYALQKGNFLQELTFCGGTALRLCYGTPRFSEDLDFEGGPSFTAEKMKGIETCLNDFIGNRYGLPVFVRLPKDRSDAFDIPVNTWRIMVVTRPRRKDIPRQRINLDIATLLPSPTEKLPLKLNYESLPKEYEGIEIRVKTKAAILADKVVAFPNALDRGYPRWRDLWDIWWLTENGVNSEIELVKKSSRDFNQENLNERIDEAIKQIPSLVEESEFVNQMLRFLKKETAKTTILEVTWRKNFSELLCSIFSDIQYQLKSEKVNEPDSIYDLPDPFKPPSPFDF